MGGGARACWDEAERQIVELGEQLLDAKEGAGGDAELGRGELWKLRPVVTDRAGGSGAECHGHRLVGDELAARCESEHLRSGPGPSAGDRGRKSGQRASRFERG